MAELEIVQLEVGLLENYCEVVGCLATGEAALVDPAFEVDRLLAVAGDRGWRVTTILLTHTHADHVAGLDEAASATGAVVRCHPIEVAVARRQAARVEAVADGEVVRIGQGRVQAIWAPGHTDGCVCWYVEDPGAVITGDVLFVGSIGRVGDRDEDVEAMFSTLGKLAALPEETRVYPGHAYGPTPTSTLAWEMVKNPAFAASSAAELRRLLRRR